MTTSQPTPPQAAPASYWVPPSTSGPDYQIVPRLRERVVGLVAALVIQATVAALGVLPRLPVVPDPSDYSQPATFWAQLAVVELLAAVVVSLAFGPGVRLGDLPAIARLLLGLGFVVLPAAALLLGGIDAAQAAAQYSRVAAASSWLATALFGTLYLGLPLIALGAPASRAPRASAPGSPIGATP